MVPPPVYNQRGSGQNQSSFFIGGLLEKMSNSDKDFRFMATNDLIVELQKDTVKMDEDTERKVVKSILKLLEDTNGEVQNLAVKCLGPLVKKLKDVQVEQIVDVLCTNMSSKKEELRDISSIGLRTVIADLPQSSACALILQVSTKVIKRFTNLGPNDSAVQLESVDIICDLLNRFGTYIGSFHKEIMDTMFINLDSPRNALRKRSINALSSLVLCCNPSLLDECIVRIVERLEGGKVNGDTGQIRTNIQCLANMSRSGGQRLGDYVPRIIPLIIHFTKGSDDDELREFCLQAFESFVRKCPKEIGDFIPDIVHISTVLLSHDPNYNYDEEDYDEMEMDGEEDNESNDEYSDDDDVSWKVRRASAKVLEAVIATRLEMVAFCYQNISPVLIQRFKEREENVKVDIFHAYVTLLKQTRVPVGEDYSGHQGSPVALLQVQVKDIVKALHKQLREKSIKTRQGAFNLLTEVITVLPSSLQNDAATLIPGILYSLSDKNSSSNMKIDALSFLHTFMRLNDPSVFQPHASILVPAILTAVSDSFYKIISEGLLVLNQMVRVIRPNPADTNFSGSGFVQPIYVSCLEKLEATSMDQEVKERAITCMATIVSTFGDFLSQELTPQGKCLNLLVDRLKNEITRVPSVKAFTTISSSHFSLCLIPTFHEVFPVLASFLRKQSRPLKLATLTLLEVMVRTFRQNIDANCIHIVLDELHVLIKDEDLHVSQLTLTLLTSMTRTHSAIQESSVVPQKVLPATLHLVRSPLLQGVALQSVLDFFQALVRCSFPGLGYQALFNELTSPIYAGCSMHKQANSSVAKCVAAIAAVDSDNSQAAASHFIYAIKEASAKETVQTFAFLALGEIGKTIDLSSLPELKEVVMGALTSSSDEVKIAASFALGCITVGSLPIFLPIVLQEISAGNKKQYLLLHSLKEVISCLSNNSQSSLLEDHLEAIWTLLMNNCECPEEGTRNVVAECLGKLTLRQPQFLLPKLQGCLSHQSPLARATVVTAVKFTITDKKQAIDPLLKETIGQFFKTLEDPDVNVRRVALVTFNSAAHNKPSLVRDLLQSILPHLYKETEIKKDLIREVEMGPFKHTVDDGLDIRKAAFECMYTLLDTSLDRIDIFTFLGHVVLGLKDHYDIKMLTYHMVYRLSNMCPSALMSRLDSLLEPLKATVLSRVKSNAVKQEFEKQEELKRAALRAFISLRNMPDADKTQVIVDFERQMKQVADLQILYEQVQKDSSNLDSGTPMEV